MRRFVLPLVASLGLPSAVSLGVAGSTHGTWTVHRGDEARADGWPVVWRRLLLREWCHQQQPRDVLQHIYGELAQRIAANPRGEEEEALR